MAIRLLLPETPRRFRPKWGTWEGLPARVEFIPATDRTRLLAPITFTDRRGQQYTAREGLESDGASIPRWAWWPIGHPYRGRYREGAYVHDQLCRDKRVTPKEAHRVFREAILSLGGSHLRAWVMWAAVRLASRW